MSEKESVECDVALEESRLSPYQGVVALPACRTRKLQSDATLDLAFRIVGRASQTQVVVSLDSGVIETSASWQEYVLLQVRSRKCPASTYISQAQ